MTARVWKQIQERFPGWAPGSHEGDAPSVPHHGRRFAAPKPCSGSPVVTCGRSGSLGCIPFLPVHPRPTIRTWESHLPPCCRLSPRDLWALHLTWAKSATRGVIGVTRGGAISSPRGVAVELGDRFPERPGTHIGSRSSLGSAVSLRQYAQRSAVVESYLAEARTRGKVSPGAQCASNLRGAGNPAVWRWARRQGDKKRRRPLGAGAGRPGAGGLQDRLARRPPAASSP